MMVMTTIRIAVLVNGDDVVVVKRPYRMRNNYNHNCSKKKS